MPAAHSIFFGTSGFQYPDWKGIVYPVDVKKRYGHELAYIAQYFDCCEINTSFYGPLKPQSAKSWCDYVAAVNTEFQFTAKLTQVFTHAPDAKQTSSSAETIKYTQKDVDEAKTGFAPLMEAGRLGAVIAQFPISFKFKRQAQKQKKAAETSDRVNARDPRDPSDPGDPIYGNWDHVLDVVNLFQNYPLSIEFRDASWDDPWVIEELLARKVAFCNVDQPRLGNSLDGTAYVTAPFAYLRLHGRNYDKWFSAKNRDERYDFLYEGERLERVKKRIEDMAKKAGKTFVLANNHPKGKAAANALELKAMLSNTRVKVPGTLAQEYPVLQRYSEPLA